MEYANIGDVNGYKLESQIVRPLGLITVQDSDMALKFYAMAEPAVLESSYFGRAISETRDFVTRKADEGIMGDRQFGIGRQLGIGFAILSRDMFNIALWSRECPVVLMNQIYVYGQRGLIKTAKRQDTRKIGSFCVWELGIVGHERLAWMEYLKSRKKEKDKKQYLENVIRGSLDMPET